MRRLDYLHPVLQEFGQRYSYDFAFVSTKTGFALADLFTEKPAELRMADLFDGMPDNRTIDEMDITSKEMEATQKLLISAHVPGANSAFDITKSFRVLANFRLSCDVSFQMACS